MKLIINSDRLRILYKIIINRSKVAVMIIAIPIKMNNIIKIKIMMVKMKVKVRVRVNTQNYQVNLKNAFIYLLLFLDYDQFLKDKNNY